MLSAIAMIVKASEERNRAELIAAIQASEGRNTTAIKATEQALRKDINKVRKLNAPRHYSFRTQCKSPCCPSCWRTF